MDIITNKKVKAVSEILMKYLAPTKQYDGIWASDIALRILKAITDAENLAIGDDMVEKLNKEQKLL